MTARQFNELQRQADVIEQAQAYRDKIDEYESSGIYLTFSEDALSNFSERVKYMTWRHLCIFIRPSVDGKHKVLFHKKCLEYGSFITDIFDIGATHGIRFTINQQKQKQ